MGFIGGLLGAMAMGYVAAVVTGGNNIEWIGMALIAAISGVFGDLVESLFKRSEQRYTPPSPVVPLIELSV